jgi:DNA-binding XRE family transcriptional regulator
MRGVPVATELACCELTRRWKQRPEFGPVNLVYNNSGDSAPISQLHCETHPNNESAIREAVTLSQKYINPMILEGNAVLWTGGELLHECERRRRELIRVVSLESQPGERAEGAMDKLELLKWRKKLGYTQEEAGGKLGVTRGTIGSWERGVVAIPASIELACCELARRWMQCSDFGPVNLIYEMARPSARTRRIHCELFSTSDAAIKRALELTQNVIRPMIVEDGGAAVWSAWELQREVEKRRDELIHSSPVQRGRPRRKPPSST